MTSATQKPQDTMLIVDFGSQYTKLIARRFREGGYFSHIVSGASIKNIQRGLTNFTVKGMVLAGSHRSVTKTDLQLARRILEIKPATAPVLGICYGMQLLAKLHGGKVVKGASGEYGTGSIKVMDKQKHKPKLLSAKIKQVWLSHGDEVAKLPAQLKCTARSDDGFIAAFESKDGLLYGLQFHPEVSHTPHGKQLLWNFAKLGKAAATWKSRNMVHLIEEEIAPKLQQGDRALVALSGGVDSTVMAVLAQKIFGKNILPLFIDNGLLRQGETKYVVSALAELGIKVTKVDARRDFLRALKGVTDPEAKRKAIGKKFIDIFEKKSKQLGGAQWLAQGTIYPDVIESSGDGLMAAQVIKSHHNVGGLPERMAIPLWEPLRQLFKDEVRALGAELGIPAKFLQRHPFPGPGLAVRILGEVKEEYLEILRAADSIFLDELRQAKLYHKVSQAFCVFLPLRSVGVIGDARSYGYVISLRAVTTDDFMTAKAAMLPPELLNKIASRIMNKISKVSRVVFDYSSKPPATIEWE